MLTENRALDYSSSIDLLVLEGISSKGRRRTEPASCTSLLGLVVGVAATSPAADVGSLASRLSEASRSLGQSTALTIQPKSFER